MVVPKLDVEVDRPVLEAIPNVDLEKYSIEQQTELTAVFDAYNTNLYLLIDYSDRLLSMQEVIVDYYTEIMKVAD